MNETYSYLLMLLLLLLLHMVRVNKKENDYFFSFSIGAGESGKSTIVKQMKWDYIVWFYSWQPQQLNVQ